MTLMRAMPWILTVLAATAVIRGGEIMTDIPADGVGSGRYGEGLMHLFAAAVMLLIASFWYRLVSDEPEDEPPAPASSTSGPGLRLRSDRTYYLVKFNYARIRNNHWAVLGKDADDAAVERWLAAKGFMQTDEDWVLDQDQIVEVDASEITERRHFDPHAGATRRVKQAPAGA
jgi:hypothetical protein